MLERELDLSLSEEKTLVTPVTSTMRFLGTTCVYDVNRIPDDSCRER